MADIVKPGTLSDGAVAEAVRLGFLRHGDVIGPAHVYRGRSDPPLTEPGRAAMHAALAENPGWQTLVTSPLARCADFARDWAQARGLPCRVDAAWAEFDFGEWDGLTPAAAAARDPAAHAAFVRAPRQHPPPGGEHLAAFDARVHAALQQLGDHAVAPTLVVTHAGVMRAVLARVLGLDDDHRRRIALVPASHFVLSWLAGEPPLLLQLNGAP